MDPERLENAIAELVTDPRLGPCEEEMLWMEALGRIRWHGGGVDGSEEPGAGEPPDE